MIRRYSWLLVCLIALASQASLAVSAATPPNIVWIFVDDMSANFSCYGEKTIQTPAVDKLASEGMRFTKAFVTARFAQPVVRHSSPDVIKRRLARIIIAAAAGPKK